MNGGSVVVTGAVEGDLDEAVLRRLVRHVGAVTGPVHGKQGKNHLQQKLRGYNHAARSSPWLVLVDLNHSADCAPPLRSSWLTDPAPYMCFRIAVRMIEAWLLSDRDRFASFLRVRKEKVPENSEMLDDPKRTVVELAKLSRSREVRLDMVPRPEGGRKVGPAYTSRLIEFISDSEKGWRPEIAARAADSLHRCLQRLHELIKTFKGAY